ncbi:peptidyl-prolyl cis-trans isomerase [Donghicola mangrovi]|uniref:Parvulin-like PPIase n=1 Tax=Donghicola mangrovi TaxID=2729614 RepID=A0A850QAZ9_9RHOB|nr:peptidyl-prolyl cis-trans isomerase [Donghicola mangrovi]NVO23635.1 peptidylprolyl isomerase [Donghicola mangrovi]
MAKSGKGSKIVVWALVGGLVAGLGGFGVTNFGSSLGNVGSVGKTPIPVDAYARALRGELDALSAQMGTTVSFADAAQMGIEQRALGQVVVGATLDNETGRIGVSVGDKSVAEQIMDIPAFKGTSGKFDRETYKFALDRAGLNESEFEDQLRRESARTFLQGAVAGAVKPSQDYINTLLTYIGQQRDVTYIVLNTKDMPTDQPLPTDAQVEAFYQEHIADFTLPERKAITYIEMTPSMLADSVEVDQAMLQQAYDDNKDKYYTPERRLVERLVYPDAETAAAAKTRLDAGEVTFEELAKERGLELADLDLGDVSLDDLDSAGETVFAAAADTVVGPLDSNFGPALFRVNAVLPEQVTTFEEAEPELREEFAIDRARRVIEQKAEELNDMLAAGATLEELASETEAKVGTIEYYDGLTSDIAGYPEFRDIAGALSNEDFPEIHQLNDGGIFAARVDGTLEPTPRPLDEVRDEVVLAWQTAEMQALLRAEAETVKAALEANNMATLDAYTIETAQHVGRGQMLPNTPAVLNAHIFEMEQDAIDLVDGEEKIAIVRLDGVSDPDMESEEVVQMRGFLEQQAASQTAEALFQAYLTALRDDAGVQLNQTAMNAVKAQFQ